jgi:hypothetical protein
MKLRERERKGDRRGGGAGSSSSISTYPNIMFVLYIIAQPTGKKLSGGLHPRLLLLLLFLLLLSHHIERSVYKSRTKTGHNYAGGRGEIERNKRGEQQTKIEMT